MSLTIAQIEALSNKFPEVRQLVGEIIKYLNDNPGGAITPGIDSVLAVGQLLIADRELHLNGHIYQIEGLEDEYPLYIDPAVFQSYLEATDGTAKSKIHLYGNIVDGSVTFHLTSYDGANEVGINGDAQTQTIEYEAANGHSFIGNILISNDIEITDLTKGVILKSPDGTRWRISIDNTGSLTTTSL